MKQAFKTLAVGLVGAGLIAFAASPAVCADDFCAMGGTLIKAEVVKEKALEWGKDRKKATIAGDDSDTWSVLTLSKTDDDIAILVGPGTVFFGIAGKGGNEVDDRDIEKVFGKDLKQAWRGRQEGNRRAVEGRRGQDPGQRRPGDHQCGRSRHAGEGPGVGAHDLRTARAPTSTRLI